MRFVYPHLLWLELLVPVAGLLCLYAFRRKRKALTLFAGERLAPALSSAYPFRPAVKAALLVAALFFAVLSLARPQFGTRLVQVEQKGADIVIAVDVSESMLAEDVTPNRLARAKTLLGSLIAQMDGNRVGIIAFAGAAFWQCPVTLDTASARLFLQIMDTNLIPLPGTAVGGALRLAARGLEKSPPQSKAVILLTDGEDHDSDPVGAAREAARQGIRIFPIGFGNPNGEPIPLKDARGNFTGYKKSRNGEVVMSRLDEATLLKVAEATGGEYFRAYDGALDPGRVMAAVGGLEKQKLSSSLNRQYEDRYQYFLLVALLCLLAELAIPPAKKERAA